MLHQNSRRSAGPPSMSAHAAEKMACLSRSPALRCFSLPSFLQRPCFSRALQPSFRQGAHRRSGLRWIGVAPLHKGSRLSSDCQVIHHRRLSVAAPRAVLSPPPPSRAANGISFSYLFLLLNHEVKGLVFKSIGYFSFHTLIFFLFKHLLSIYLMIASF